MKPTEAFSKKELKVWPTFSSFLEKCHELMEFLRSKLDKKFEKIGDICYPKDETYFKFSYPKKKGVIGWIGFYSHIYEEQDKVESPNYKTGVYGEVLLGYKKTSNNNKTNFKDIKPEKPYFYTKSRAMINFPLTKIINGNESADKQKQKLLKTFMKMLNKLENSKEFKRLTK